MDQELGKVAQEQGPLQEADRQGRKGEGSWPVALLPLPGVCEENTYLLRGPLAAPGRL